MARIQPLKPPRSTGPDDPDEPPRDRTWVIVLVGLGLVLGGGLIARACVQPEPAPPPAPSSPVGSSDAPAPAPARCALVAGAEPFVIGDPPKVRPKPAGEDEDEDELIAAPFAVELGRADATEGGFAVGLLHEAEGGTVAAVATLGLDGGGGRLTRLARSRGDMEPPVVVAQEGALLVGMLEPNAGGRALKVLRLVGDKLTWGPEFAQSFDDSMAYDLASGAERAVAVWDDVGKTDDNSRIYLSTFDASSLAHPTAPAAVSPDGVDAESPRVVARPGGFWLVYVVRGSAIPKHAENQGDESERGEDIDFAWLHAQPLDEQARPVGDPRAVTPKSGRVLSFDLRPSGDHAVLAYRDDAGPSGAGGGSVRTLSVALGGPGEPTVVVDEGVGSGVPSLLGGWLSVNSLSGPKRLAPIGPAGELTGDLRPEPAVGPSEPMAAKGDTLLLAFPAGKAVRLTVATCSVAPDAATPTPTTPTPTAPAGSTLPSSEPPTSVPGSELPPPPASDDL